SGPVIGIDLGTTYSCVGIWENDAVTIIPNEQGKRITASCVAFTKNGRLIGDEAKEHSAIDPENVVTEAKRLIGRKFTDVTVQSDMKNWPFKVVNENSKPMIEVKMLGRKRQLHAE